MWKSGPIEEPAHTSAARKPDCSNRSKASARILATGRHFPRSRARSDAPTVVNNVETLSNIPHIINRGADWYKSIGPEKSPGPKLFCLSGHVNLPGLYELPMGFPLKDLIYGVGGGILGGKQLKGVIPGGSSFPVFTAEEALKVNMDFDSVRAAGSLMGTAGVMVMHEDTCMVDVLKTVAHFYHHESCGQCTPCREGCGWIEKLLTDLEDGPRQDGRLAVADRRREQHGRQHHLRAGRQPLDAGEELRAEVSQRVRRSRAARAMSISRSQRRKSAIAA